MKELLLLVSIVITTGCVAGQPEPLHGPAGKRSYSVECMDKEQNCYPQAKKLCPKGYVVTDSKCRAIMNWQGFEIENALKYTILIECND